MNCDLDLGDMTRSESHNTIVFNIIQIKHDSKELYGSDKDLDYVCTVTLTFEIGPFVKVMTHPRVMDNNCVKYYPDPTKGLEDMARTLYEQTGGRTDRQTDRRTDRVIPIYPNLLCGGIDIIIALHMLIQVFKHRIHPDTFFSAQALFSITDAAWCHKFLKIG